MGKKKRVKILAIFTFLVWTGIWIWQRQPAPPAAANELTAPTLSVNAASTGRAISPLIYGMNFADPALANELGLTVNRWGGNATTRYNWQIDVSNRGSDWFFENIPNDVGDPADLPAASAVNRFVEENHNDGREAIITVPLIGWTPRDRTYADCSFRVSVYGPQQATDPWWPDCGNGVRPDGTEITGNDPHAVSIPIDETWVHDWVAYLANRYGTAAQNGVRFYALDNEPMLWNETHRDVHPMPASYDMVRDRTYDYAAAIKAADPGAQTLGPAVWGWTAYFYSALDWEPGGSWWNNPQDRNTHGGTPFLQWYLQQMQAYEQQHGVRILDYLDIHYYPQASGVALSNDVSPATQALRLRSTRSLWDPTYGDESWIGEPVQLIPRMRQWIDDHYPGTKLAITEYHWGAHGHINGALAQADVLGIFGREGVDLATLWQPPSPGDPVSYAFRMYRNYDGQGARFGNLSVSAGSSNQDVLSVYAARRSADGALTIMVVNKSGAAQTSALQLSGYDAALTASAFRYSTAQSGAIQQLPPQSVTGTGFTATYPANSMTLFVLTPSTPLIDTFIPLVRSGS